MTDGRSLLAHLRPWFYQPVEDRGTDALAYILNKSSACQGALDGLLRDGSFRPQQIRRLETQVIDDSRSRPDMVGYDGQGKRRLMVEAKFWAALQPCQGPRYLEKLDDGGSGVLLFIAPESRIELLWPEIIAQFKNCKPHFELDPSVTTDGVKRARVNQLDKQVALISWELLLDRMVGVVQDFETKSDIHQLRGLIQEQNERAFPPLAPDATAEDFEDRDAHFRQLIIDVVNVGRNEKWVSVEGLSWGITAEYRRRFFTLLDTTSPWMTLGVEYRRERFEKTPLWVMTRAEDWHDREPPPGTIRSTSGEWLWSPITVRSNAVYDQVVTGVVDQLKSLREQLRV